MVPWGLVCLRVGSAVRVVFWCVHRNDTRFSQCISNGLLPTERWLDNALCLHVGGMSCAGTDSLSSAGVGIKRLMHYALEAV